MGLLNGMREKMFWSYDRFHGGKIRQAYIDLKKFNELGSNSTLLDKHRKEALEQLLEHAVNKTEHYSQFRCGEKQLDEFPVVNKHIIRESQDSFLASSFNKDRLYKMATSGSTGAPFVCYQDENKRKRVNAEVIYFSEKLGYTVGKRIIVLRGVVDQSRKSKAEQLMQNIVQVDVSHMDDKTIEELLIQIEHLSRGGSMLLAYSSTYDILKEYFSRKGVAHDSKIFGLVAISEMFFDDTRMFMESAFNCRCLSRYSNQENGILGQDDLVNNTFLLNEAHYYFEILETDFDHPVVPGEVGRIVVTDLYNYAMPMIRYDTGDVGKITTINNQGIMKKTITDFGGRKIDMIYDAEGRYLSPHKVSVTFWSFPELKQFQFVQKGAKDYLVRLNVHSPFVKQKRLEVELLALLGDSARLEFEYTDTIPILSSGKRKYIQNDYFTD